MRRNLRLACIASCLTLASRYAAAQQDGEWRAYGHDAANTRYSPLSQITRENVSRLAVAWTYRTGEIDTTRFHFRRDPRFEATPLMVDGTLYL
jgi:quinoprotein glucose dehydrogenase